MSKEDIKIKGKIDKKVVATALIGGFVVAITILLFDVFIWKDYTIGSSQLRFKFFANFVFMGLLFGILNYYKKSSKK